MPKTKWGVVYNADAPFLDDMLHLHRWQSRRVRDSIWTAEAWRDAFVPSHRHGRHGQSRAGRDRHCPDGAASGSDGPKRSIFG